MNDDAGLFLFTAADDVLMCFFFLLRASAYLSGFLTFFVSFHL